MVVAELYCIEKTIGLQFLDIEGYAVKYFYDPLVFGFKLQTYQFDFRKYL